MNHGTVSFVFGLVLFSWNSEGERLAMGSAFLNDPFVREHLLRMGFITTTRKPSFPKHQQIKAPDCNKWKSVPKNQCPENSGGVCVQSRRGSCPWYESYSECRYCNELKTGERKQGNDVYFVHCSNVQGVLHPKTPYECG